MVTYSRVNDLKEKAIKYGYARYSPTTGYWEWIVPEESQSD